MNYNIIEVYKNFGVEQTHQTMKEKNLELGSIVMDGHGWLGVIMAVFNDGTVRLDSNGVVDIDSIRLATDEEKKTYYEKNFLGEPKIKVTHYDVNGLPSYITHTVPRFVKYYLQHDNGKTIVEYEGNIVFTVYQKGKKYEVHVDGVELNVNKKTDAARFAKVVLKKQVGRCDKQYKVYGHYTHTSYFYNLK